MKMNFKTVSEVYDANNRIRRKLIDTVSGLSDQQAGLNSENGKWTIQAIVEHLFLVEASMTKISSRLLEKAEAAGKESDGGFSLSEGFFKNTSDIEDRKFEAPDVVLPGGSQSISESLALLNQSREKLNRLRPKFESLDGSGYTFPHPLFGPLTAFDWLALIGGHEARHTRQILNILANHR